MIKWRKIRLIDTQIFSKDFVQLQLKKTQHWCMYELLSVPQFFVYGRKSGSASSAFHFPYNSMSVGRILYKFCLTQNGGHFEFLKFSQKLQNTKMLISRKPC